MTQRVDLSGLLPEQRLAAADKIRALSDFNLPELEWFNSDPCERHSTLDEGLRQIPTCRRCGVKFRAHQRVGIAWLYLRGKGLIADQVGPQPLDALVLTPTGYRRMGELVVGDELIDPDGAPSTVTGIYEQGVQAVYRILFSDGTHAESTLNHLWYVRGPIEPYRTRVGGQSRSGETWHVRSLDEIRSRSKSSAVPLIRKPPDFRDGPLPLDPYLLGLLLGDGSLVRGARFYSADDELIDAFHVALPPEWVGTERASVRGCRAVGTAGSIPILRDLGLLGKRAWEKFVPQAYLWSSAATRLAVLQGLMDTDGWWAAGSVQFSSTSRQLAEDVLHLARSLGLRTFGPGVKTPTYSYKGERRTGRTSYSVGMAETQDIRVFRLKRKLIEQPRRRVTGDLTNAGERATWKRDQRVKWIRDIQYFRTVPVRCISVSAPSQLYVTNGWTVTHNTGKSAQAAGLIALIKQNAELDNGKRVVVICRPAAIDQWRKELIRFLPGLHIVDAAGTRAQRVKSYISGWDILITGYQMLLRDQEDLDHFQIAALVIDDVDPLRNRSNRSAAAIKRLARRSPRVIELNATPLQKKLRELHSMLEPVGGYEVFGSETNFRRNYERTELISVYNKSLGREVVTKKTQGYKNIDDFIRKVAPMTLRRTAAHITDVDLPEIMPPHNIYLDLYPAQQQKYEELREGVLKIIKTEGSKVKRINAVARFVYGAMVCSGLATIGEPDGPGSSSKLDWVENALVDGDLSDEKVVVFLQFTKACAALSERLSKAGVEHAMIWGRESGRAARAAAQEQFWEDPNCRVLIGTAAMEASLNLQVARHLINVDTLLNPARMQQLVGRIRRDGSAHRAIFVHNLFCSGTQEEGYLDALRTEQALADAVWSESNELYEALSPLQMLQLIGRSK